VTAYWVELSIHRGCPVPPLGREFVTCRPLPYQLPLPGMNQIRCLGFCTTTLHH
jgi:hypothetical protein